MPLLFFLLLCCCSLSAQTVQIQSVWKKAEAMPFIQRWEYIETYLLWHPQTIETDCRFLIKKLDNDNSRSSSNEAQATYHRLLGLFYYELDEIDIAQKELLQSFKIYDQLGAPQHYGAAMCYWLLGELALSAKQQPQRSFSWLEKAEQSIPHDSLRMLTLASKASYYALRGEYLKAAEMRYECIKLAEKYNSTYNLYKNYIFLSELYIRMTDIPKADFYLQKSFAWFKSQQISHFVAQCYSFAAVLAIRQQKSSKALLYLDSCLQTIDKIDKKNYKTKLIINAAALYSNLGNPQKALQLNSKTLPFLHQKGQRINYTQVCLAMGGDWHRLGKLDSAEHYALKVLPIAQEMELLPRLRDTYRLLSEIAFERADYQAAFIYKDEFVRYKDSVFQQEKLKTIWELETSYETQKKQRQITSLLQKSQIDSLANENQRLAALEAQQALERERQMQELKDLRIQKETAQRKLEINELEKKNKERALENADLATQMILSRFWLLLTVSLFVVFIVATGFALYRYRSKKQQELQRITWEKQQRQDTLQREALQAEIKAIKAQMNPHFIFNSLNSIQFFIFTDNKRQANHYLGQFSRLMRMVLEMSNVILVSLEKELELLVLYMELECLRLKDTHTHVEVADNIDPENVFLTSMLIQPHIENAFKHGLRHRSSDSHLWLRVSWEKEEEVLRVEIEDNGIGREQSKLRSSEPTEKQHRSFSVAANERRLRMLHRQQIDNPTRFIDKKDEQGNPIGTLVIVLIPISTEGGDI